MDVEGVALVLISVVRVLVRQAADIFILFECLICQRQVRCCLCLKVPLKHCITGVWVMTSRIMVWFCTFSISCLLSSMRATVGLRWRKDTILLTLPGTLDPWLRPVHSAKLD